MKKPPNSPVHSPSGKIEDVVCTGATMEDLAGDLDLMQAGGQAPSRCYLCKRQDGEDSMTIEVSSDDKRPSVKPIPITLCHVERKMKHLRMHYKLCVECAALLGLTEHL
jgi:hypothetical protein